MKSSVHGIVGPTNMYLVNDLVEGENNQSYSILLFVLLKWYVKSQFSPPT